MYIKEILQYLLWPALIIIAWIIIWNVLKYYEKTEEKGRREA